MEDNKVSPLRERRGLIPVKVEVEVPTSSVQIPGLRSAFKRMRPSSREEIKTPRKATYAALHEPCGMWQVAKEKPVEVPKEDSKPTPYGFGGCYV